MVWELGLCPRFRGLEGFGRLGIGCSGEFLGLHRREQTSEFQKSCFSQGRVCLEIACRS